MMHTVCCTVMMMHYNDNAPQWWCTVLVVQLMTIHCNVYWDHDKDHLADLSLAICTSILFSESVQHIWECDPMCTQIPPSGSTLPTPPLPLLPCPDLDSPSFPHTNNLSSDTLTTRGKISQNMGLPEFGIEMQWTCWRGKLAFQNCACCLDIFAWFWN